VKAVLLKSPGIVVLDEIPVPVISEDEVLVEVKYCGICGSDVHTIPDCGLYQPGTYMGHEIAGVLAKVGRHVKGWQEGDRVVVNPLYICGECYGCHHGRWSQCEQGTEHFLGCCPGLEHAGGFARYVRLVAPERRLTRLPDEVSFASGTLVEPLAVSLHALRMSALKPGDSAMVLGAGMIGLGLITFLKHAGAGLIVVSETMPGRMKLAMKFGADSVINPRECPDIKVRVRELTEGKGIDVVYDCSGVAQAFRSAPGFLRKGGQLLLVGQITREVPVLPTDFTLNEIQLQGICCYYADEFPMVLQFLKKRLTPVEKLITSEIKLSEIVEKGFNVLFNPGSNQLKIIVAPDV